MHTQTILGDVTHPTPVIVAGQQSGFSPLLSLLLGALGASVPVAGVGGYLLSQAMKPDVVAPADPISGEAVDQSLDLGLLRIDDLKTGQASN